MEYFHYLLLRLLMWLSGYHTVGNSAREVVGNRTSGKTVRKPVSRVSLLVAITQFGLREKKNSNQPVPMPFWFLTQLFSQTFLLLKFILIYQKGHWFTMSAFKIWLSLVLPLSLPYCTSLFINTILLFDPALKICNAAPRQLPWKKSITTHACTNAVAFLLMIHHIAVCIYKRRLSF